MKFFPSLVCAFLLGAAEVHAQPVWEVQKSGTIVNLNAVSFCNSLIGTAVGDSGVILHTTNGGEQWDKQFPNTINHLSGVSQIDSLDAVIVGDSGVLLRTSDSGESWKQVLNGIIADITALSFRNHLQGIALGDSGLVLLTTDGGYTWMQTKQPYGTNSIVLYATDSILYAGCMSFIRSTDGGNSWNEFNVSDYLAGWSNVFRYSSMEVLDLKDVFICGGDLWYSVDSNYIDVCYYSLIILKSSDNANSWNPYLLLTTKPVEDVPSMPYPQINYFDFIYDSVCIAFDNFNNVYSNYRNLPWSTSPSPVPNPINAVTVADDSVLFAVGNGGSIIKLVGFEQAPVAVKEHIPNPVNFSLFQNYPNPVASNQTTINYDLAKEGQVTLKVYTLLGEEIAAPVAGWQSSGVHSVSLDASRLPDGVYFYRLETNGSAQTKMLVVGR